MGMVMVLTNPNPMAISHFPIPPPSSSSYSSSFVTSICTSTRSTSRKMNVVGYTNNKSKSKHYYCCICLAQSQIQTLLDTNLEEKKETLSVSEPRPRRLILLRHARSSWEDRSLRDHDRPLSKAGQADAAKVSHKLQDLGWVPELILSSDAVRTRQTLKIMQNQVQGFLDAEVHFISSFYSIAAMDGQTAEHLQEAICKYSRDEILTVMCMGHNRGWEEAASSFSGASIELKTCYAALLEATGKSWEEAFSLAGPGGWKLQSIVKPHAIL